MNVPKLPSRIQPPEIPNSMRKGLERQEQPKSSCFQTLLFTVCFFFLIQSCLKRGQNVEPEAPVRDVEVVSAPALSEAEIASLPEAFVQDAERLDQKLTPRYATLGSLDSDGEYKMLVTLTNRGAAVVRVELNEEAYEDNSDKTGYLGQIIADEYYAFRETSLGLPGVATQVVGADTPAAKAGLRVGDRITGFIDSKGERKTISSFEDLRDALLQTKPEEIVKVEVYEAEQLENSPLYKNALSMLASELTRSKSSRSSSKKDASDENSSVVSTASEGENSGDLPIDETKETAVAESLGADSSHSEQVASENDEKIVIDASAVSEEIKNVCVSKTLEIKLSNVPLSVIRPSGMVWDYDDYVDLAGLQGVDYRHDVEIEKLGQYRSGDEHVRNLNCDPCSFLTTLAKVDDAELNWVPQSFADKRVDCSCSEYLSMELDKVDLRNGYWDYVESESSDSVAVFKKVLLDQRLEVVKRYELAKTGAQRSPVDSFVDNDRAYHLNLNVTIRNYDSSKSRTLSYLQDGPTGLPLEGAWFSSGRKTGPGMGAYGMRDLVVETTDVGKKFDVIKCMDIAQDQTRRSDEQRLNFIGVDGQYFQCTMLPYYDDDNKAFAFTPLRVGPRYTQQLSLTDVSFRVRSVEKELNRYGEDGDAISQDFAIFVGPKQRDVMADYGLSKTIVYGWFWFVSIPLLWILHFFHDYIVFNYGLAIILLTILVRLLLYPLSRKQVSSSIKMQKLQPELAKLKEKYKDNPQEMSMAQMALFKKHGVNPLSGCLPIFIQMPIFIGLYKALSLDVNLYGAPLFSKSLRWCSNLAAPDMAYDWSSFWSSIGLPNFSMSGPGFLSMFMLGPYLNILPVVTIALFLIQQKMMVPPPVGDDQQARQQRTMRKMMSFMMVFMGFMFFKVPSGLCVYFIVSSLWGLLERKMLPKRDGELVADADATPSSTAPGFESNKEKRRSFAKSGRSYEVYEPRKDKGKRGGRETDGRPKSKLRLWWEDVLERAQEQQRLAKAEYERREKKANRNKRK